MFKQKSFHLKTEDVKRSWFLVDAQNQVVGRLATKLSSLLRGKISAQYTPSTDSGNFVVVVNCEKMKFTGRKWQQKKYYKHSGHIGGLSVRTAEEQKEKHPELILMKAVERMLPKNSQGRKQLTRLKVLVGPESQQYAPQKPQKIN